MIRWAPALSLLAVALAPSASAQQAATAGANASPSHDSNSPIDWDADRIEVQDKQHRAILTGNVRVRQQEMTLTADRVTANYTGSVANSSGSPPADGKTPAPKGGAGGGPQVHRLDATGNVVVTRPTEVAHGQYGIYDLDKRLITLIGHVSLDRSGANGGTAHGGRLIIDLNTGHANMDGSAVGGNGSSGSGGRVSGRFTVPPHDAQPAAPAKPAGK